MRSKIIHALLTLAITLTCLISTPLSLTTRAANADGSITKTATYCDEGDNGVVVCDGTVSLYNRTGYDKDVSGNEITDICSTCGRTMTIFYYRCSSCTYGANRTGSHDTAVVACYYCSKPPEIITYVHTHADLKYCEHGLYGEAHYYNTAYGYSANYLSTNATFKVWPITIVGNDGLTGTVSVSGATATDAAISGKTVTVRVNGITAGTKIKITNSGTDATNTITASSTSYNYTFTMPAKATTITIELGQLEQAVTATLSATSIGYGGTSTLSTSGAKTTLSYTSSNPAVATINSSGVITIKGIGTTAITINAAETTDYKSASTTVTLTVVKGNISTKIAPTASLINYGQSLSSSTLSGGSVTNSSGSAVEGSWTWLSTSSTIPKVGTTQFAARFTPTDTTNYNY